jgi:hypothetical protein
MRIDFRTVQRGYTVVLSQDLFGAYVLYRRWFGLSNRRGGMKQQIFVAEEKAMREVGRISRAPAPKINTTLLISPPKKPNVG